MYIVFVINTYSFSSNHANLNRIMNNGSFDPIIPSQVMLLIGDKIYALQ